MTANLLFTALLLLLTLLLRWWYSRSPYKGATLRITSGLGQGWECTVVRAVGNQITVDRLPGCDATSAFEIRREGERQ